MALLAALGIGLSLAQWSQGDRSATCSSDFLNFYTGARLAFSGHIYQPAAEKRVQYETLGCSGEHYGQFVRLPYFAALLWPLAQLPFGVALLVWRCLSVAAVVGFVWMWPGPRWRTLAVCAWSFPLMAAFAYGQDVPIVLLAAGAGIVLLGRERDWEAGLCLAVGAAKPHLFVILVLMILARRRWRAAPGLGAGGLAIAAVSFLTGGWGWPREFWRTVTGPAGTPNPGAMINLHGIAYFFGAPLWIEAVVAAAFLALIAWASGRMPAPAGFALALAGGVLLGGHSYLYDLAFSIPLLLVVLASPGIALWLKWAAGVFASPVVYLMPLSLAPPGLTHFLLPAFLVLTGIALALGRQEPKFAGAALPAEG